MKYVVEFFVSFILLVIKNPLSLKEIINNSEQCNSGISELLLELNFHGDQKQKRNSSIYYATSNIHKNEKDNYYCVKYTISLKGEIVLKNKLPINIQYIQNTFITLRNNY